MPALKPEKSGESLLQTLSQAPHVLLQPEPQLSLNAISLAKQLLDPLAEDVASAQCDRRDENRRKRKRGQDDTQDQVLQLRAIYTQSMAVRQVWEQARRVLDAACNELERSLPQPSHMPDSQLEEGGDSVTSDTFSQQDMIDDSEQVSDEEPLGNDSDDLEGSSNAEYDDVLENDALDGEDIENDEQDHYLGDSSDEQEDMAETWTQDKHGLNDAFFSIDDFNKQSQFLEQMDARGEDDNPSDEDEIDWDADPLGQPLAKSATAKEFDDDAEDAEDGDDDEAGPTFGNADLNAPDSDEEDNADEEGDLEDAMPGLNNTNDIRYADFFEAPPKKLSKTKRMRALPKTQPPKAKASAQAQDEESDAELERAMNDVNRDIFASESEAEDTDSDGAGPQNRNMSTHERQRAKIAAEIRRLEAANVAKRDWTLSGEARAADRPLNSLIEEDLDFERVGKPVPVVTAETSEEIEQLIKRRIIAREFDEVLRRHPDSIGSAFEQRRGRIELDDTKPQSGLAEVYEQEHLKANDPNYVDQRSKQTKKQHADIAKLWKEVSYQLDLLSNLHFKPKRIEAEIKVVEDKPRIAMEDARPTGGNDDIGEQSMLAPQEVYRAGDRNGGGGGGGGGKRPNATDEVMRASGAAVNKEEMTREEKKRRRQREKERAKKAKINQGVDPSTGRNTGTSTAKTAAGSSKNDKKQKKSKGEDKQDIIEELKRGGVQVVGKKGDLQSLSSKKGSAGKTEGTSSSALKL